jgi:TolB protein
MDIHTLRQWIAQRDSYSILETLDVFTGVRTVLKEFETVIEAPNWTQDGRFLVYNSKGRIYTYELATTANRELESGFAIDCNNDHVLSPDSSQVAVSHFTFEDAASRIYILPITGGSPTLVTEKGPSYLHGWSPDGQRLAYCAERGGQYDIYSISVQGGPETQLTNMPGLDDGPEYSPDGRHIWFNSTRSGLMQVWRMGADGSNPTHMVQEESTCCSRTYLQMAGRWFTSPTAKRMWPRATIRPTRT